MVRETRREVDLDSSWEVPIHSGMGALLQRATGLGCDRRFARLILLQGWTHGSPDASRLPIPNPVHHSGTETLIADTWQSLFRTGDLEAAVCIACARSY
jgi:hypothetical protein